MSFGTLDRGRVATLAFKIIDAIQEEPLEYAAASIGLVLETLCDTKKLSRGDIMMAVSQMLRTRGLASDQYVDAVRMFIQGEVPNG